MSKFKYNWAVCIFICQIWRRVWSPGQWRAAERAWRLCCLGSLRSGGGGCWKGLDSDLHSPGLGSGWPGFPCCHSFSLTILGIKTRYCSFALFLYHRSLLAIAHGSVWPSYFTTSLAFASNPLKLRFFHKVLVVKSQVFWTRVPNMAPSLSSCSKGAHFTFLCLFFSLTSCYVGGLSEDWVRSSVGNHRPWTSIIKWFLRTWCCPCPKCNQQFSNPKTSLRTNSIDFGPLPLPKGGGESVK